MPGEISPDKAFVVDGVTIYNNGQPTGSGNALSWKKAEQIPGIDVADTTVVAKDKNAVYRVYNPNSGEHMFTISATEKNNLVKAGWSYEGVGWYAPLTGGDVYRLYNPNAGNHMFTTSATEKAGLVKAGWKDEGVVFFTDKNKKTAVYRVYNPNSGQHMFTTSATEKASLVKAGWKDEGTALYGV